MGMGNRERVIPSALETFSSQLDLPSVSSFVSSVRAGLAPEV